MVQPLALKDGAAGRFCAACLALMLCAGTAQAAVKVRHQLPDLKFALRDDDGHLVTQDKVRGYTTLLYFGYSGCGDACPLTLTRLTRLARQLDPSGRRLRILFVSVTPGIDTPRLLHAWLEAYDSPVLSGLSDPHAEDLARRLRAAWPVLSGSAPVHSTSVYVFDREGQAQFLLPQDDNEAAWRAAIASVING